MLGSIARAVHLGEVSARELVGLALERIERLDTGIGAVVALRAEGALAEAATLDARVAAGEDVGPLAGVPFLVKDIEDLTGLPTTHGSLLFADAGPARRRACPRAPACGRRHPVGKSNAPEFATEVHGEPAIRRHAQPWNAERPRRLERRRRGGRGGHGAGGHGDRRRGSIGSRPPSAARRHCRRTVSCPPADPVRIDLSTDGPLATSVAGLRLLLDVEAGPAPGDPTALPSRRPEKGGLPRRALAAPRFVPWGPIPATVATAFDEALAGIEQDLGLPVEPVEPQALFRAGNPDLDWFVLAGAEHVSQLGRALLETNLDRLHPTTRAFMEAGMRVTVDEYVDARRRRFEYVRELDELLGDDLVIATPAVAAEGWSAEGVMPGASEPGLPAEVYNTALQNVTGHPAISVPSGLLPNGLPFGLQFTGPRFRDDMLLDLADAWERARPWPVSAPGYEPFWS
jgi:Asp-tRNA(Asn)/Glu-tRNA(Gln) amidotransferase A subunit family amidase